MTKIIALILLAMAAAAYAIHPTERFRKIADGVSGIKGYTIPPGGYEVSGETITLNRMIYSEGKTIELWKISKGTEAYTLDEFVSSGKFCLLHGHRWVTDGDPCSLYAVWPPQSCPKQ